MNQQTSLQIQEIKCSLFTTCVRRVVTVRIGAFAVLLILMPHLMPTVSAKPISTLVDMGLVELGVPGLLVKLARASIAASRSNADGLVDGVDFELSLGGDEVNGSTGLVIGPLLSRAKATAIAETGTFIIFGSRADADLPVLKAGQLPDAHASAWAFAKGGLKVDFASPAQFDITLDDVFLGPGTETVIAITDTSDSSISNFFPANIDEEIVSKSLNTNSPISAVTPSNVWFFLSAKVDDDLSLTLDFFAPDLITSPITASDFAPANVGGVDGLILSASPSFVLDFPTGTSLDLSLEVGTFAEVVGIPEPKTVLLLSIGLVGLAAKRR